MTDNVQTVPATGVKAAKGLTTYLDSKGLRTGIIVAAVVTAIGVACWILQLTGGMGQTGMRSLASWGLYIMAFMFAVGLAVGAMLIAVASDVLGVKALADIRKPAAMAGIAACCAGIGLVVVDVGGPLRLWEMFAYSNLSSPLMWDMLALGLFLIVSCVYLWAVVREETGKISHVGVRAIGAFTLAAAILAVTVDAWFLALAPAHEMWHTALMPIWFVFSALSSGTGLVLLVAVLLGKADDDAIGLLAKVMGAAACADLFCYFCDLVNAGYSGLGAEVVGMLLSGPLSMFFWCQVLVTLAAIIIVFAPQLRTKTGVLVAACLVMLGAFLKRVQLIVGGFQVPNLDMAAIATPNTAAVWQDGFSGAFQGLVYTPAPIEIGVTLGIIALGALIFMLGLRYLPLGVSK